MSLQYNPDSVGHSFVKQYYSQLSSNPAHIHRFYSEKNSQFSHDEEGARSPVAVGQKNIHSAVTNLNLKNCNAAIRQVDCQGGFDNNSIVIQVIGTLTSDSQAPRNFCQTFVLQRVESQTAGNQVQFLVFNDIFRYLKDSAAVAPAAEVTPVAVVETPAPAVEAAPVAVVAAPAAVEPEQVVVAEPAKEAVAAPVVAEAQPEEKASRPAKAKTTTYKGTGASAPAAVAPAAAAPAVPAAPAAVAAPAAPAAPAQPFSWANRAKNFEQATASAAPAVAVSTPAPAAAAAAPAAAATSAAAAPKQPYVPRSNASDTPSPAHLFVTGIPLNTTQEALQQAISAEFGVKVKSVRIPTAKEERPTLIASVYMDSVEAGAKVLEKGVLKFGGSTLHIREHKPASARPAFKTDRPKPTGDAESDFKPVSRSANRK